MPVMDLGEAVRRFTRPEDHLHFAATPSRSNAAIRAVSRAYRSRDPRFTLSMTGFHSAAHQLGLLGLGARYLACFYGDLYPVPRPNPLYTRLHRQGAVLENWSLLTMTAALRAGALGHRYAVARCSSGTDLRAELQRLGRVSPASTPDDDHVLVNAIRPDVTFIHSALGDATGRVVMCGPRGEGLWSTLAADRGVIATVEKIVDAAEIDKSRSMTMIAPHRILAICPARGGAHPQPLYGPSETDYTDDFAAYLWWRQCTTDTALWNQYVRSVFDGSHLDDGTGHTAFRTTITASAPRPVPLEPAAPSELLTIRAARLIEARVREAGHTAILAGIGRSFQAVRLAHQRLTAAGIYVPVLVETGVYGADCATGGNFLVGYRPAAGALRHSDVEDVLGALVCGGANRCLAVIGAAQVDAHGRINSTRLADGTQLVGSGGAHDLAAGAEEVIVLAHLAPERLVEQLDYVTSSGQRVSSVVTDYATFLRTDNSEPYWTATDRTPGIGAGEAAVYIGRRCRWSPSPSVIEQTMAPVDGSELAALRELDAVPGMQDDAVREERP